MKRAGVDSIDSGPFDLNTAIYWGVKITSSVWLSSPQVLCPGGNPAPPQNWLGASGLITTASDEHLHAVAPVVFSNLARSSTTPKLTVPTGGAAQLVTLHSRPSQISEVGVDVLNAIAI